jgi:hypothetical protein
MCNCNISIFRLELIMDTSVAKEEEVPDLQPVGGASQIIEIIPSEEESHPPSLNLHQAKLKAILERAGDRKVAVIAIVGESCEGKSLFLNFILRYLEAIEKDCWVLDWLDLQNQSRPLSGFEWSLPTHGILMWNRPFILKKAEEEIAVLVVDTPGTSLDSNSSSNAVIALTSLISSCLIVNSPAESIGTISNLLSSLQPYSTSELLAKHKNILPNSDAPIPSPFQRLYFLIRDWNVETARGRFPHGVTGGKAFLSSQLLGKETLQAAIQNFQVVDCCLMASIGDDAALPGFTGSVGQLSYDFVECLEEVVENIAHPDELPIKTVFGNEVSASSLFVLIEKWVTVINREQSQSPLSPQSLFFPTAYTSNFCVLSQCHREYVVNMGKRRWSKTEELLNAHDECNEDAQRCFKRAKILATTHVKETIETQLKLKIQSAFKNLQDENRQSKIGKLVESFTTGMKKGTEKGILSNKEFERLSTDLTASCVSQLKDKARKGNCSVDDEVELFEELNTSLRKEAAGFYKANSLKVVESVCRVNFQCIMNECKDRMEALVDNFPFISETDLMTRLEERKKVALEIFSSQAIQERQEGFNDDYHQLSYSLENLFSGAVPVYRVKKEEAEIRAEVLLVETRVKFGEDLRKKLWHVWDNSELQREQTQIRKDAKDNFKSRCPFPRASSRGKELINKLIEDLESAYSVFHQSWKKVKAEREEYQFQASDEAFRFYTAGMEKAITSMSEVELKEEHKRLKGKALELFTTFSKSAPVDPSFVNELRRKLNGKISPFLTSHLATARKIREEAILAERGEDLLNTYRLAMSQVLDTATDERDFLSAHEKFISEGVAAFRLRHSLSQRLTKELTRRMQPEILSCSQEFCREWKAILAKKRIVQKVVEKYRKSVEEAIVTATEERHLEDIHLMYWRLAQEELEKSVPVLESYLTKQLNLQINAVFKSLKMIFVDKLAEIKRKVGFDFLAHYLQEMNNYMEVAENEAQFEAKHQAERIGLECTLKKFQSPSGVPPDPILVQMLVNMDNAYTRLKGTFITRLTQRRRQHLLAEAKVHRIIKEIVIGYREAMSVHVEHLGSSGNLQQLDMFHVSQWNIAKVRLRKKLAEDADGLLRKIHEPFLKKLVGAIQITLEEMKAKLLLIKMKDIETRKSEAETKAKGDVDQYLQIYREEIFKFLENATDIAQLKHVHAERSKELSHQFEVNYVKSAVAEDVDTYCTLLKSLKAGMEKILQDANKQLLKKSVEEKGTREVDELLQKYRTELIKCAESVKELANLECVHSERSKYFIHRYEVNHINKVSGEDAVIYRNLLNDLRSGMINIFQEVNVKFERKREEEMKLRATKEADALQEEYRVTMAKHTFDNCDEGEFERLHKKSSQLVVSKFMRNFDSSDDFIKQLINEARKKIRKIYDTLLVNFLNNLALPREKKKEAPQVEKSLKEKKGKALLEVRRSVKQYRKEMLESLDTMDSEDELYKKHIEVKTVVCRKFAEENLEFCVEFLKKLDEEMARAYLAVKRELKDELERKKEATLEREVKKYTNKYCSAVNSKLDSLRDEAGLEFLHENCLMEAQRKFRKYNGVSEQFEGQLETEIKKAYEDIRQVFQSKLEFRKRISTSKPLNEARKFYRKEMERVLEDSQGFLKSSELKVTHKHLVTTVIKKVPFRLCPPEKADLESQLYHMYRKYKEQNEKLRPEMVEMEEGEISSESGGDE